MANFKALDKFFEDKTYISGDRPSVAGVTFVKNAKCGQNPKSMNLNLWYKNANAGLDEFKPKPGFADSDEIDRILQDLRKLEKDHLDFKRSLDDLDRRHRQGYINSELDKFFEDKTYISGDRLSVADVTFVMNVKYDQRPEFKNLNRYYKTVNARLDEYQPALEPKKQHNSADLLEQLEKAQAKSEDPLADLMRKSYHKLISVKNPLETLPPTTFDFVDFKRKYSNNPPEVYLPYFWQKFDAENCSIWSCEYKFANELGLVSISSNVVDRAFDQLHYLRKQSFGSMIVFGEDNNNTIAGLWVWRGQNLMFNLTEDWQVDYESFDWKKLDPESEETKKLVDLFFKQEEDSEYHGKNYADSKIFK